MGKTKLNSTIEVPHKNHNKQASDEVRDYNSFKVVLFYCSLIVFLPVLIFFTMNSIILHRFFSMSEVKSNIYSAIGSVIVLHCALGLYIYRAYFGVTSEIQKKAA